MKTSRQINAERKKEGKPPLNFALFRKVIKKLETAPEAYDQVDPGREDEDAPCGTAACLGGWADLLSGRVSDVYDVRLSQAARSLGLTGWGDDETGEADIIFSGAPRYDWPAPYSSQWTRARSKQQEARVAVRYLNHIIKTGKITE